MWASPKPLEVLLRLSLGDFRLSKAPEDPMDDTALALQQLSRAFSQFVSLKDMWQVVSVSPFGQK